jgi:hypothetical protein
MRKMMLNTDRLKLLLEPQGFLMRWADTVTKEILFIRPSSLPRLFEHLNVQGQGKVGEAVYATTAVSGSTNHSHDPCVSEVDHALLYSLQTDKERHWTIVTTIEQAQQWEDNLARNADSHCRATAQKMGPPLCERLQPALAAVDRYIEKLGMMSEIFDSEALYFTQSSDEQRKEAERLAFGAGHLRESSDDVQLACLVLVKFGSEVEGQIAPYREKKVHEDASLRARIYLLVDYLREQREAYRTKY